MPSLLEQAASVTLLVGMGTRDAKEPVLEVARKLAAPMVLTLKAKEGLDDGNIHQVGQSRLIGNPAAQHALESRDALLMVGTEFPYRGSCHQGKTGIRIDCHRFSVDSGMCR
ncbi:hypothetical protein [Arthrobacter sp. H35-D1]|uniref:hypothetical protein n=1 Tax=Arthrobacter sp. H35-D1 TaxID=3046202 RepID=UPI0024BA5049|nr:hypothetical protein [Arthrobacter sp. H35-D1]MDJ0313515.1 hypothetical protein [Arthrobacter sp. H35-D1]